MGFFSTVRSSWDKAQVAAIVQQLFETLDRQGLFSRDPASVANELVELTWNMNPPMFEGRSGPKPHKTSVAAAALAYGLVRERKDDHGLREAYALALATVMATLQQNWASYPFHHVDLMLIEEADEVFGAEVAEEAARIEKEPWLQ